MEVVPPIAEHQKPRHKFFLSVRFAHIIMTLVHVTVIPGVAFSSLNFALVCMVNRTHDSSMSQNNSGISGHCKTSNNSAHSGAAWSGTFNWDKHVRAHLLAAYSWGALSMVFVSGWLCNRLGSKKIMVISCAISTVAVTMAPVAAIYGGWKTLFIARFVIGIGAACSWPAIGKVAALWAGPNEDTTAMAIPSAGFALGAGITNFAAGFLCKHLGWEAVFYGAGIAGSIHLVVLLIFFSTDPSQSRWISETELVFITGGRSPPAMRSRIPWLQLLTSISVIAVVINGYAERTVQFFVMLYLPTYFTEAFDETPQNTGIASAIPFIAQILGRILSGIIGDKLKFSKTNETINAKIYNTIAFASVALFLFCITLVTSCNQAYLVTVLMTLQYLLGSLVLAGYMKAALLIAPPFVGVIMGINTTGAFLAGALLPLIKRHIAKDHGTRDEILDSWRHVIYFVIGVVAFGAVTFLMFGSSIRQKWSELEYEHLENEDQDGPGHNEVDPLLNNVNEDVLGAYLSDYGSMEA